MDKPIKRKVTRDMHVWMCDICGREFSSESERQLDNWVMNHYKSHEKPKH